MLLNEYEIAENILASKRIKAQNELFIVAKYLRREIGCDVLETFGMLSSLLQNSNYNYDLVKSMKYLEDISKNAANHELKKVEEVIITQNEINKIRELENPKQERLLFTLLVYAKFNNAVSDNNNNWCNIKIGELYKIAKVSTRNAKEKAKLLNKFKNKELIAFSKNNTNLNMRCLFVDECEENIYCQVTDLRELGYQYIALSDDSQFIKCVNCGVLIRKKSKKDYSTKYCNTCKEEIKLVQKRNSFAKCEKAEP